MAYYTAKVSGSGVKLLNLLSYFLEQESVTGLSLLLVSGVFVEFPQAVIERIARRFSPEKIILFGSRARGTADERSDFDLVVLFDEVADPNRRSAELHAALGDFPYAADIVVSTTGRFERYQNVVNTVYWPAAHEGRVLYERTA